MGGEIAERFGKTRAMLHQVGQQHLLSFWNELSPNEQLALLSDIDQIDFEQCAALVEPYVRKRPTFEPPHQIAPAPAWPTDPAPDQLEKFGAALQKGESAIRGGRVAAFTVAGGQGTRLGYDGPKGGFAISPIRNACLFQIFAESLRGTERRYGHRPRWYIMTSPSNHAATIEIFEQHAYFGLHASDLMFFSQGQMPAFMPDGRIALEAKHRVALSPDGHGGSLRALANSGALRDMRERGIDVISYFQVDNPLVRTIDPLFVGLHLETGSEMSSKSVAKADDLERVGNFCLADGRLCVIEYSDLPESLARARHPDGTRMFDAGSIAIHLLDRAFVERLTTSGSTVRLPWHRADKKVEVVDLETGQCVVPKSPNAVKLETFVFDAIPLARNPLVLMTRREEEFSPVKNAEGVDSPATTRRDLIRRAARWLESAGAKVPRRGDGEPDCVIEISAAFSLDAADLKARGIATRALNAGERLLIA